MKYNKEERLAIGQRIYDGEIKAQLEALTKDELIQVILKAGVTKNKLNQIIRKRV